MTSVRIERGEDRAYVIIRGTDGRGCVAIMRPTVRDDDRRIRAMRRRAEGRADAE